MIGPRLFKDSHYEPQRNAQANLSGLTHYCDDDTLSYFGARVDVSTASPSGLYFGLVESMKHPASGAKREYRSVWFDVSGHCVRGQFRKDKGTALGDMQAALRDADADPVLVRETIERIRERCEHDIDRIRQAAEAAGKRRRGEA